MTYNSLLFVFN